MKKALVLGLFLFSQMSFASILTVTKTQSIPGTWLSSGYDVPAEATLSLPSGSVDLTSVGHGTRVAYKVVNVYRASLLVSDPEKFVRKADNDQALNSLDGMSAIALRMEFVYSASAKEINDAFSEGLVANKISMDDERVKAFQKAITAGGELDKGTVATIVADEKTGILHYEGPNGVDQQIQADSAFLHGILSIWLGAANDANLKAALISGN